MGERSESWMPVVDSNPWNFIAALSTTAYTDEVMPIKFNLDRMATVGYMTMVHVYAAIGILFVVVFVALQLKLTNVKGGVDPLSDAYRVQAENVQTLSLIDEEKKSATDSATVHELNQQIESLQEKVIQRVRDLCTLKQMGNTAGGNVRRILGAVDNLSDIDTFENMTFVVKNHLKDRVGFEAEVTQCEHAYSKYPFEWNDVKQQVDELNEANILTWTQTAEWNTIKTAIEKDQQSIHEAALRAGIKSRLLVANLFVEQMRLYYTQRELYQRYFEPLKILANSNKTSLGVMSIKEETAQAIESHLINSSSPYYLGEAYESALSYPAEADVSAQRYERLTNENHYYNYFYGALYIKQLLTQWQKAGHPIETRPEIVATLFNVGFSQSRPNSNPQVGGSSLAIEGVGYSFGGLAHEFYYSGELSDIFPL